MTDPRYSRVDETRAPSIQQRQGAEIAALVRNQAGGGVATSSGVGPGGMGPPGRTGQAAPGVYEPNELFEATLQNAPTGLGPGGSDVLVVSILDNAGNTVFGPANAGVGAVQILEDADGHYVIPLQAPNTPGQYSIFWDDTSTPDTVETGSEDILVDVNGGTNAIPPATIITSAAVLAPAGFLLCDGAAYLIADFSDLYDALGGASSVHGSPDGFATQFNVPDMVGRMPLGAGTGVGLTTRALGAKTGTEPSNMPSHDHGGGNHQHGVTAANGLWGDTGGANNVAGGTGGGRFQNNQGTLFCGNIITAQGGGADNMPPHIALNFFIRT
jgi:microcystin-dependent protein